MPTRFLPYGRQDIDEDDITAVVDVLRGDWLTTGPQVEKLEKAIAERVGAKHVVACSNGTAALHLATMGSGLGPGEVAIVPAITFQATASAVLHTGADVVFADVDADTALMTPLHLEEAVARATRLFPKSRVTSVLPVHLAGRPVPMGALSKVADEFDLKIIEDGAHALGTVMAGDGQVGSCRYSHATTFSFHAVKTITTGEGGAVCTNDSALAERMRRLCNHGIVRTPDDFADHEAAFDGGEVNPWYYEVAAAGFNYRLSDIQCALGYSQLKRLDRFTGHRREILSRYRARFDHVPGIDVLGEDNGEAVSWHLAIALIDFGRATRSRGYVMRALAEAGIGTQVHYIPLYRHPVMKKRYGVQELPGAERYYARALSLPLHHKMSVQDAERVADHLEKILFT